MSYFLLFKKLLSLVPTRRVGTQLYRACGILLKRGAFLLHSHASAWEREIVISFLLVIFNYSAIAQENNIKLTAEQINTLGISLGKLQTAPQIPLLYAPAKVVVPPKHIYIVSSSQAGLVLKLNVGLGDEVKKGELLAEIDSPELITLQSQLLKANSLLNLASHAYQRDKTLVKEGVIPARRLQETQAQYNAALFDVNESRQQLVMAGLSENAINDTLKTQTLNRRLSIYAPISGVIMERLAVAGERITNLAPLYRMADLSELWLRINIPQERITNIHIGDFVKVTDTDIESTINTIAKSVESSDQTLLARAIIKGKPLAIHIGQNITVQITQALAKNNNGQFVVPDSAIMRYQDKAFIFVRDNQGFTVKEIALLGKEQNDRSIIAGELNLQNDIALQGSVALKAIWLGLGSSE